MERAQDLDVGHDAMATDDAGEVLHGRKKLYFIVERNDFLIICSRLIAVSFEFLRPGDHKTEVGGLSELRQFGRLWR